MAELSVVKTRVLINPNTEILFIDLRWTCSAQPTVL